VPSPDAAAYYRTPTPDEPIKTGDIFLGGALVAPGDPRLSLSPRTDVAPSRDVLDLGPLVDEPVVGIG